MGKKRRWVAVSCNHGEHADARACSELWEFLRDYKPHFRIHLGDIWDTTAWRAGACGTSDEGADVGADWDAGSEFLQRYEPHLVFLGNHDVRPHRFLRHPNALLRHAAAGYVRAIEMLVKDDLGAELVPYDIRTGWRRLGGTAFCHGWMFSENAIRDHVETVGMPVVMGHLHYVGQQVGRCIGAPIGSCVGCLANIESMDYAKTRRATTRWGNGWAYGEFDGDTCTVQLHRVEQRVAVAAAVIPRPQETATTTRRGTA